MKCASPAVKQIYANEIFTRLSATGNPMAADLLMETTVKHTRASSGKVEQAGTGILMEHICEEIPNKPPQDLLMKELRTEKQQVRKGRSKTHDRLRSNSPLIAGYKLIHEQMEFWHHTNEPIVSRKNGQLVRAKKHSYELPKKETLNPQVLQFGRIGTKRAINYL